MLRKFAPCGFQATVCLALVMALLFTAQPLRAEKGGKKSGGGSSSSGPANSGRQQSFSIHSGIPGSSGGGVTWSQSSGGNKGNWNQGNSHYHHDYDNHNHYGGSSFYFGINVPYGLRYGIYNDYPYARSYIRERYYYDGPQYVVPSEPESAAGPPLPTSEDVALMDDEQLHNLLLSGVRSLQADMEKTENGSGWIEFLALNELRGEFARTSTAAAESTSAKALSRERLQEVSLRFESTAANESYTAITRRWGFQVVRVGLPEALVPSAERRLRQFSAALAEFQNTLARLDEGPGWKRHLRLDELSSLAADKNFPAASQMEALKSILSQFDTVAREPKYRAVVGLEGFIPLHVSLGRICDGGKTALPEPPAAPEKLEK